MVYGNVEVTTSGKWRFIPEGCLYCSMSTGGQHSFNCPYKPGEYERPEELKLLKEKNHGH
jgi:biotin synthase-like enzyme